MPLPLRAPQGCRCTACHQHVLGHSAIPEYSQINKKKNQTFFLPFLHFSWPPHQYMGKSRRIYSPMFSHHKCKQAAVEKPLLFQLLLYCCQIPALPWLMCPFLIYMGFAHSWILVLPVIPVILIILLFIFQMTIPITQDRKYLQSQWTYWDYSQGSGYKGVLSSFSSLYANLRPINPHWKTRTRKTPLKECKNIEQKCVHVHTDIHY